MIRRRGPRGQSWWTFLCNHTPDIAAMDLFVVPTFAFGLLYGFVVVRLGRRELIWIGVTSSPTAEWIARLRKTPASNHIPLGTRVVRETLWREYYYNGT